MFEFISMQDFCQYTFDRDDQVENAALILQAILEARSPRLSDLSHKMPAYPDAKTKCIQRFLAQTDTKAALQRLFWEDAPFVLGDPTEIPRPRAKRTSYVGWRKDGETIGFWLLLLAVPFWGQAIPFNFVTYSSQTIRQKANSRNLEYKRAFQEVKTLFGEKPLVLDHEFSYEDLLESLVSEGLKFVIRLKLGSNPPLLFNDEGQRVGLVLEPGQHKSYRGSHYKGKVPVNIAGAWRKGLGEPLWVMTNLVSEEGLEIYQKRMKIEEAFKDLKSLLCLDKLMNKQQGYMEKMVAMVLLAYSIGLLVGEAIRDQLYGKEEKSSTGRKLRRRKQPEKSRSRKWKQYSGLFILLKHKIQLSREVLEEIIRSVMEFFTSIIQGVVRTLVRRSD